MDELAGRIAELSFLMSQNKPFTLASGHESSFFCDLKPSMMDPKVSFEIAHLLLNRIQQYNPSYVGGLELGAVPLISQVVMISDGFIDGGFIVRKKPKGRGGRATGNPPGIEGIALQQGKKVVILEDVSTTGGSSLKAADYLEMHTDCEVVAIISVVDRQEGARSAIESSGKSFESLFTIENLISSGSQANRQGN
tara:strand:- start:420 stop:1004 length:585 start_codon:yes stop_codon:yes gene_type:complete